MRRLRRYIRKRPHGEALMSLFLEKASYYKLSAAVRLACEAGEVVDVIADNAIPLVSVTRGQPAERKVYSFWYTRLKRERPEALPFVQSDTEDGDPAPFLLDPTGAPDMTQHASVSEADPHTVHLHEFE